MRDAGIHIVISTSDIKPQWPPRSRVDEICRSSSTQSAVPVNDMNGSSCATNRQKAARTASRTSLPAVGLRSAAPRVEAGVVLRRRRMASAGASMQQSGVAVDPAAVDLAHRLADAAARVTTRYFRSSVAVDVKSDASPVTIADKEAETAMRALIKAAFPEHGVFGEEHGLELGSGAGADWLWVLDPIDGTKSFITGKPLFGTLISLLHRGTPLLGVIDQPMLRERWLGVAGQPSTLNGAPIRTRSCGEVGAAYMYSTTPHMFSGENEVAWQRLRDSVRIPLYGCDCYAYGLLAAGHCDLVVEADLKPYDYMALVPVIQGAGGVITDWAGQPLRWHPEGAAAKVSPGEVLAAGDARTHAAAMKILDWPPRS